MRRKTARADCQTRQPFRAVPLLRPSAPLALLLRRRRRQFCERKQTYFYFLRRRRVRRLGVGRDRLSDSTRRALFERRSSSAEPFPLR